MDEKGDMDSEGNKVKHGATLDSGRQAPFSDMN